MILSQGRSSVLRRPAGGLADGARIRVVQPTVTEDGEKARVTLTIGNSSSQSAAAVWIR